MSLVSFVNIRDRSRKSSKKAITDAMALISYDFPKNTKNVVIKPNLCYYWDHSTGQTTDPEFVAGLIELILESIPGANVSVVESDASAMKCKYAFKMLGYKKLQEEFDISLVNLTQDEFSSVETKVTGKTFNIMVPKVIQEADVRINIPKIKYMIGESKITCALKNIFGCNPYPKKFKYHPMLAETIVALNKAMKFDLCLVDGNIASGVQPQRLGLVMASIDPVAIDTKAAWIAGVNHKKIRYLQLAAQEGLGSMNVTTVGVSPKYFRALYPKRPISMKLKGYLYNMLVQAGLGKRLGF